MTLTLITGPNFSGRSAALRGFAWTDQDGRYLHPDLELNFSGLADTVGGERHLWSLAQSVDGLPDIRRLTSLSGGERALLLLHVAIAGRPERLAIDGCLDQLDQHNRHVIRELLVASAAKTDIRIVDCDEQFGALAERSQGYVARGNLASFNNRLGDVADGLGEAVLAPDIVLTDIWFRYPRARVAVFEGAAMTFRGGRVHLLKAPNGAGKSTLARLMLGILKPQRGNVAIDGNADPAHQAGAIFHVFQNPRDQLYGGTPLAYLRRVEDLAARSPRWRVAPWLNAERALVELGLTPFVDTELFDMPLVALKRLCLAGALVSRAPWIFIDEPAFGLDRKGRLGLAALFERLAGQGLGIIIVSHGEEFDRISHVIHYTIRERKVWEGARTCT